MGRMPALGEMTPEEPDRPQLQKCVQSLAERDVSFSSPTRSQEMSGDVKHGPQWRAVVKDSRLSIHKEAILCIVYLPGPYLGNFNAFLMTVKSASLRIGTPSETPDPGCSSYSLVLQVLPVLKVLGVPRMARDSCPQGVGPWRGAPESSGPVCLTYP